MGWAYFVHKLGTDCIDRGCAESLVVNVLAAVGAVVVVAAVVDDAVVVVDAVARVVPTIRTGLKSPNNQTD